jgi:hypothetical protein
VSGAAARPLGISGGSCPGLGAAGLAETALGLGVSVVDLRAGKGHAWEGGGVGPLLAAGVSVAFVGTSVVLGREQPIEATLARLEILGAGGFPVKVFATAELARRGAEARLAERQARTILDWTGPGRLLVETHHGYAAPAALAWFAGLTGCRLLLDTYGLARLGTPVHAAGPALSGYLGAAQVKGYDEADPERSGHLPLSTMSPAHGAALDRLLPPGAPVLVESRAGTLAEDLAVLGGWLSGASTAEGSHA